MKVYLKSGRTIRVSQKIVDKIIEMKVGKVEPNDILVSGINIWGRKITTFMIDIDEVAAIK